MKSDGRSTEAAEVQEILLEAAEGEGAAIDGADRLFELVATAHEARVEAEAAASGPIEGVVVGLLVGFTPAGEPLVDYPGGPSREGIVARAMTALGPGDRDKEVALLFEGGRRDKPVVMGKMHAPGSAATPEAPAPEPEATADGERLVFSAEKEIVLQCGKASITLTRAGKILIRGAYLLTRSSGVNRIQGGSVQIN